MAFDWHNWLNWTVRAGSKLSLGASDTLLPNTCLCCGTWIGGEVGRVCADCRAELARLQALPYCPRCGRTAAPVTLADDGCGRCRRETFWNLRELVRIGSYDAPLRNLILRLKYGGDELLADYLGELLVAALTGRDWSHEIDWLIPVPMHWLRRWQRPCDHARLLAEALGQRLDVPVRRAVVRRVRYSPSQTNARTRHERFQQVRDCFATRRGFDLRGRTVCLVDNLLVSGATLHELSRVLRAAGARRIYAIVAGRSVRGGDAQAILNMEAAAVEAEPILMQAD